MKVGDLVRLKDVSWFSRSWRLSPFGSAHRFGVVLELSGGAMKIMMNSGKIKSSLTEFWEVASESR